MSALRHSPEHLEALADQHDAQTFADLREPAIDSLIEEALALVPDWLRDELWNRDLDLKDMARAYVEAGDEAIRERVLQLNRSASEQ